MGCANCKSSSDRRRGEGDRLKASELIKGPVPVPTSGEEDLARPMSQARARRLSRSASWRIATARRKANRAVDADVCDGSERRRRTSPQVTPSDDATTPNGGFIEVKESKGGQSVETSVLLFSDGFVHVDDSPRSGWMEIPDSSRPARPKPFPLQVDYATSDGQSTDHFSGSGLITCDPVESFRGSVFGCAGSSSPSSITRLDSTREGAIPATPNMTASPFLPSPCASSLGSRSMGSRKTSHVLETNTLVRGEDEEGNKTINEYSVIQEIGRGSYGKVKLVVHMASDGLFAIKIMNKSILSRVKKDILGKTTALDDVLQEVAIMKQLDHPNVVKMHEVINDPESNKLYLIMDYLERGPVYRVGADTPLAPSVIRDHLKDICKGLDYLHQVGIIHRDVKPENILVDKHGICRLTDFGVSNALDEDDPGVVMDAQGTPAFLTPEQVRCVGVSGVMADVWALGVTLFVMATTELPFSGQTWPDMSRAILEEEPDFSLVPDHSLRSLLVRVLNKVRSERIASVTAVQTHPFVGKTDPGPVYPRIAVSARDRAEAVKTGRGIALRMQMTARTLLKVDMFRRRSLRAL
eukprot:Hpha_TRINITY_DN1861_c0_g1::TRINITY_DN1861_c0_g1_i1::g.170632::m.170632/K07359/CAMKK2; calcium/calmodulin-dependent protein kinase kinase 2